MKQYNGISIIPGDDWCQIDAEISTDSSLDQIGGYYNGRYFHALIPDEIKSQAKSINEREAFAVLVACRLWLGHLKRKNLLMHCDNESTVYILNSGRSKCDFAQDVLREIRFLSAQNEARIRTDHIEGLNNRISDCLSRWDLDAKYRTEFFKLTSDDNLIEETADCSLPVHYW